MQQSPFSSSSSHQQSSPEDNWTGPIATQQQTGSGAEPNYTKRIMPERLRPLMEPFKLYFAQMTVIGAVLWGIVYIPSWRWKWHQRKLFNRHVIGRVIDLVPNVGEERWQKLYLDYSRATLVHLVGRRNVGGATAPAADTDEQPDNRPKAPNPIRKTKSFGYQMQQEQIREAELEKENKEATQDVFYDAVEDACMPDTQLGVSDIMFRPADAERLQTSQYDTAVLFSCLAWEDVKLAGQRIEKAWSCVKPGGVLLIIDVGRPSWKVLQILADFVESYKTTSLRLTMDYEKFIEENIKDAVWPPEERKRALFGIRYSIAVRKETEIESKQRKAREEKEQEEENINKQEKNDEPAMSKASSSTSSESASAEPKVMKKKSSDGMF